MMLIKKIVLAFLFLAAFSLANGQSPISLGLMTQERDYTVNERVLCVLDQEFYLVGEPVNFKAITYDVSLQIPIGFSSVVYVELFNQDNSVVASKKILMHAGAAINSLTIPRNLPSDYYYFRAYTNYMKNFGCASFFTKRIKIVNPFLNSAFTGIAPIDSSDIKIEVVAEGGRLVYGLDNKLVISCNDSHRKLHVSLFENDSVINKVELINGLQTINFSPRQQNRYRVEAISLNTPKKVIPLKDISQSGVICQLDSVKADVAYLKLQAKNFNDYPLGLSVENGGFNYVSDKTVQEIDNQISIRLPAGLNNVMLKNKAHEVVTQRYIYVLPEPSFNISAEIDNSDLSSADSISFKIRSDSNEPVRYLVALNLGDSKTMPSLQQLIRSASFNSSITSATNSIPVNGINPETIPADNINHYLALLQPKNEVAGKLDKIAYLPELRHDIVTGNVRLKNSTSAAANQSIYLSFVDSICWLYRAETDSLGCFRCNLPLNYQGNDLVVSMLDTTETYDIVMDNEFFPFFAKIVKEKFIPDSNLKDVIEARMVNLQITDAYSIKSPSHDSTRSHLRFYGIPNAEYNFTDYISLPSLKEFIFEIVDDATPKTKKEKVSIGILSENKTIGTNPLVVFDGVPVVDIQKLLSLPCIQFQSLRIVTKQFFFGNQIYDGVIDITSKDRSFSLVEQDKNSLRVVFPHVNNSSKQIVDAIRDRVPNFSSTLFFNTIEPVKNVCDIAVKRPDNSGKYSLVVFGYSKDGKCSLLVKENLLVVK